MYKDKKKNKIRLNTTKTFANITTIFLSADWWRALIWYYAILWRVQRWADGNDSKIISFKFITLLLVTVIQSLQ